MYLRNYVSYTYLKRLIGDCKFVVFYYDLRNLNVGIYKEDKLRNILTEQGSKDLLSDVLNLISEMYNFSTVYGIHLKLVFFYDLGESQYHKNILKSYKSNRKITKYNTLPLVTYELSLQKLKTIYDIMYKVFSKLYNVYFIRLMYLESDFIPHYFIYKNVFNQTCKNLILTNDKDFLQTLKFDNTIVLNKFRGQWKYYDKNNWLTKFGIDFSLDVNHFPFMLSIVGDKSDGIPGVKGIGWKKLVKLYSSLNKEMDFSNYESYYEEFASANIKSSLFQRIKDNIEIVKRNYKLIAFEEIIRNLSLNQINNIKNQLLVSKLSFKESVYELKSMISYVGNQIIEV